MDIALIDPDTGLVVNTTAADSINDAQLVHPKMLIVERGNLLFEPGARWIDGELIPAPPPPPPSIEEQIATLETEVNMPRALRDIWLLIYKPATQRDQDYYDKVSRINAEISALRSML